jgi:biopolymer transport protein TolR
MPAGKRGRRLMGTINVVPYIDVMLVLLIIFMVTAPLLTQGVQVDLPQAASKPIPEQNREPLVVSVDKRGRFYVNVGDKTGSPVSEDELVRRVRTVLARDAQTPVLLKADQAVPYGRVVAVMSLLDQAGAAKVGFLTDPVGPRSGGGRQEPR